MSPAGLNVLNNGRGDGIVGATTDSSIPSAGIHGINSASGSGSTSLPGVNGPAGVFGESTYGEGIGVVGWSSGLIGIKGVGGGHGIEGIGNNMGVYGSSNGSGVHAEGGGAGVTAIGAGGSYGVWAQSIPGNGRGVYGNADNPSGVGVEGDSNSGVGVEGGSDSGTGVWGYSRGVGVRASADDERAWALLTDGDVLIQGNLYVRGSYPKSALIKFRDGSHRALYCVESPECWFEDFGRSRLVRGKAQVRLDPTFAAVIRTSGYHVFLSPEGLSQGLYVSRMTSRGFEVREQHRGTSTVSFSYRVVGHRKDVQVPRFKRIQLSAVPKSTRPSRPKLTHIALPSKGQLPKIPGLRRPPQFEKVFRSTTVRRKVMRRQS